MILQRFAERLAIPTIRASGVWPMSLSVILTLVAFGCQSAEQRQANELRGTLLRLVDEIAQLNQEEIATLREWKEVIDASPPSRGWFAISPASAAQTLEATEKSSPKLLAKLRQQVEEYTDPELPALAQIIRARKAAAKNSSESAQRRLQQAQERKNAAEEQAKQAPPKPVPERKVPSAVSAREASNPPPAAPKGFFTQIDEGLAAGAAKAQRDRVELRQSLSQQIDELDQIYGQWINKLKADQEAQTDHWEKRWAGDRVTLAAYGRKKDIPALRSKLERSQDNRLESVEIHIVLTRERVKSNLE